MSSRRRHTALAWFGLAALQLALLAAATLASPRTAAAGANAPARWQIASEWSDAHGRLQASAQGTRGHAPTLFALPSLFRFALDAAAEHVLAAPRDLNGVAAQPSDKLPPSRAPPATS